MIESLIIIPVIGALATFCARSLLVRRWAFSAAATAHLLLTIRLWWSPRQVDPTAWLIIDALGLLVLTSISILFFLTHISLYPALSTPEVELRWRNLSRASFNKTPARIFSSCLLLFLAAMTLVTVSQHLGLLWASLEATTLVSAPLFFFHRSRNSLEAMWKYLLVCSSGIALGVLGIFFIAASLSASHHQGMSLTVYSLLPIAKGLDLFWLKLGYIFIIVGFGTKMGLAPFHLWLPDAHSEAPSSVSTLFSGALLNCAFLGILRTYQVCDAAGINVFCDQLLVLFGIISLCFSAIFLVKQLEYKRMLAYSSIEHMGLLALSIGMASHTGSFFGMFHLLNHSLTKGLLFLCSGNFLNTFHTKKTYDITGSSRLLPITSVLWLIGLFAICGLPPFSPFISKFGILQALFAHSYTIGFLVLSLLVIIVVAMSGPMLSMVQGGLPQSFSMASETDLRQPPAPEAPRKHNTEPLITIISPLVLAALILVLGVYMPTRLQLVLQDASALLLR